MPPAVIDAMRVYRQQLSDGEGIARAIMARRWLQVERALRGDVLATIDRIVRMRSGGASLTPWRVMELSRYQSLRRQSRALITRYVDDVALPVTATRQRQLIDLGSQHATQIQRMLGVRAQFGRVPTEVIENLAGLAGDGSPLRDLLRSSYGSSEADAILTRMITGVARGEPADRIARAVIREGYSQSLERMMTTMRTEPLRAYRETSRQTYLQSSVVIGYRRLAALDTRTCLGCLLSDGEFYPLTVIFEEHPNGRCSMVPVLGQEEPDWETGPDWFDRQSENTKRGMMGEKTYQAWRDGKFGLPQLVKRVEDAQWGNALIKRPFQELPK